MKRFCHLIWLFAAFFVSFSVSAQGTFAFGDMDTYLYMLGEECPIEYDDAWAIYGIVAESDTIRLEFQMPSSLSGFLTMLTGEGDNVKRMWMKQLKGFGYPWDDFMGRLAKDERPLVITFHPKDSRKTAEIVFLPEDFAAFVEKEQSSPSESQGSESDDDKAEPLVE